VFAVTSETRLSSGRPHPRVLDSVYWMRVRERCRGIFPEASQSSRAKCAQGQNCNILAGGMLRIYIVEMLTAGFCLEGKSEIVIELLATLCNKNWAYLLDELALFTECSARTKVDEI
jgi:hypothetical protein